MGVIPGLGVACKTKGKRHSREPAKSQHIHLATTLLPPPLVHKNWSWHRQAEKAKPATFSEGKITLEEELL